MREGCLVFAHPVNRSPASSVAGNVAPHRITKVGAPPVSWAIFPDRADACQTGPMPDQARACHGMSFYPLVPLPGRRVASSEGFREGDADEPYAPAHDKTSVRPGRSAAHLHRGVSVRPKHAGTDHQADIKTDRSGTTVRP